MGIAFRASAKGDFAFIFCPLKSKDRFALAVLLSWLEHHPNQTPQDRVFDPWLGNIQKSTNECINKWDNKSLSLSLSNQ